MTPSEIGLGRKVPVKLNRTKLSTKRKMQVRERLSS